MELQAALINKLAVAGKFGAAFFFGPRFAFGQKFCGVSALTIFLRNKYSFQISDGRTLRSFNIVIAELALGKSNRLVINILYEADRVFLFRYFPKLVRHSCQSMIGPHLYCQPGKNLCLFYSCSFNHFVHLLTLCPEAFSYAPTKILFTID